jgi:hypothetical protein
MAEFPFATGIENGNFSKWRNSRLLPASKTGVFKNGGIPVCYRPEMGKSGLFDPSQVKIIF